MIATLHHSLLAIALITLLELAVIAQILLRPHRVPASRIAWMVVVGVLPLFGMLAYLLLGEVNIGRRRVERLHAVLKRMPPIPFPPDGENFFSNSTARAKMVRSTTAVTDNPPSQPPQTAAATTARESAATRNRNSDTG